MGWLVTDFPVYVCVTFLNDGFSFPTTKLSGMIVGSFFILCQLTWNKSQLVLGNGIIEFGFYVCLHHCYWYLLYLCFFMSNQQSLLSKFFNFMLPKKNVIFLFVTYCVFSFIDWQTPAQYYSEMAFSLIKAIRKIEIQWK